MRMSFALQNIPLEATPTSEATANAETRCLVDLVDAPDLVVSKFPVHIDEAWNQQYAPVGVKPSAVSLTDIVVTDISLDFYWFKIWANYEYADKSSAPSTLGWIEKGYLAQSDKTASGCTDLNIKWDGRKWLHIRDRVTHCPMVVVKTKDTSVFFLTKDPANGIQQINRQVARTLASGEQFPYLDFLKVPGENENVYIKIEENAYVLLDDVYQGFASC